MADEPAYEWPKGRELSLGDIEKWQITRRKNDACDNR